MRAGIGSIDDRTVKAFIRVGQAIGPTMAAAFEDLDVQPQTIISGDIADDAALHGILARCRDLGIPVVDVRTSDTARPLDHDV